MKALSLHEPWASMIARGEKTIETRRWATSHRGALLICASKKPARDRAGCAVAIAVLVNCRPMERRDEAGACCELYAGARAWILEHVIAIEPFPVSGRQRLFEVDVSKRQIERKGKGHEQEQSEKGKSQATAGSGRQRKGRGQGLG